MNVKKTVVNFIFLPVFAPSRLVADSAAYACVARYGWTLILARWFYYWVVFQFRDYHQWWAPFSPPPFGLSVDAYSRLQRCLAVPFGLALMLLLAAVLVLYLRYLHRRAGLILMLNILGATFFLPFVLIQPCDLLLITFVGWHVVPVVTLHTIVLVWESWAAIRIVSAANRLSRRQQIGGIVLLCGTWIGIAGAVWR